MEASELDCAQEKRSDLTMLAGFRRIFLGARGWAVTASCAKRVRPERARSGLVQKSGCEGAPSGVEGRLCRCFGLIWVDLGCCWIPVFWSGLFLCGSVAASGGVGPVRRGGR